MEFNDEYYMKEALKAAQDAYDAGEVPIGTVIVHNGEIIGRGFNRRNTEGNPLCHAEIIAINEAAHFMGDWRIEECTMYVTVEPCPMCAGAIVQARIPRVVYGAKNPKAGCAGSVLDVLNEPKLNHQVDVTEGVLKEECAAMMKEFFKRFRKKEKKEE
jgi:tRNA(adenine34) deaminase